MKEVTNEEVFRFYSDLSPCPELAKCLFMFKSYCPESFTANLDFVIFVILFKYARFQ